MPGVTQLPTRRWYGDRAFFCARFPGIWNCGYARSDARNLVGNARNYCQHHAGAFMAEVHCAGHGHMPVTVSMRALCGAVRMSAA